MKENEIFLLDVQEKRCPMTTVHVRVRLDSMTSGEKLKVLVKGSEPCRNVAASVQALGHYLLERYLVDNTVDLYCLIIKKS